VKDIAVRAFALLIALGALTAPATAEPREVIGYAGVLGEWELTATVNASPHSTGELSGPITMTHVGICTQDGPEKRLGEIRLRMSGARLNATLLLAGVECSYDARLSDAYKGQMTCPDRPALPLTLWVR
jgi:hypothetical protein